MEKTFKLNGTSGLASKRAKLVPGRTRFFMPLSGGEINAFAYDQILIKFPVSGIFKVYGKDYLGMND